MQMMKRNVADHNPTSSMSGCTTSGDHHHEVRRGPWTLEEDSLLTNYIVRHGEGRWNMLAKCAGLKRTGKSCRLRWLNYLKPDTKRGNLSSQEQLLILQLHSKWGNRWSKIAQHLPGRTDNEIKNYWRTRVQKQARLLNIDTATTTATHDDTAFLELAAVRSCLWPTPTCFHLHKVQHQPPPPSSSRNTITADDHFDHSQPIINIIPNPAHDNNNNNKPVIYTSAPPPPVPNLAPPSISTSTHQSQLHQPAASPNYYNYSVPAAGINNIIGTSNYNQLDHDFSDLVQFLPQSSWGGQGVGHATANVSYNYNINLDQSCNSSISNGYGDHEMLGNCTMASTSALQPYFDPNSTHHQCHDMERAAYADVANTLWNMDDIWQIRDQELSRGGI